MTTTGKERCGDRTRQLDAEPGFAWKMQLKRSGGPDLHLISLFPIERQEIGNERRDQILQVLAETKMGGEV